MKLAPTLVAIYALLCILGGLMGYIRAESGVSLIVGGTSGIALYISARAMNRGSRLATYIALVLSAAIGIRFAITFFHTLTAFPHLLMLASSMLSIAACVVSLKRGHASA